MFVLILKRNYPYHPVTIVAVDETENMSDRCVLYWKLYKEQDSTIQPKTIAYFCKITSFHFRACREVTAQVHRLKFLQNRRKFTFVGQTRSDLFVLIFPKCEGLNQR